MSLVGRPWPMAATAQQSHTLGYSGGSGASTCISGPGGLGAWIWISLGWAGPGQSRPRSTEVTRHHYMLQAGPHLHPHPRRRLRLPAWSTMSCSTSSIVPAAAKWEGARQRGRK